ncbi:MAG: hypothetical protein ABJZ62_04150 [Hyphomicrobiales bacterium]
MMKRSNTAAGLLLAFAAFTFPQQAALAGHKVFKSKTTTVTTTETVTETVTKTRTVSGHKSSKRKYVKKPHVHSHDKARSASSHKVKTKRAKLIKPKTKRHDHFVKGYHGGHQKIGAVNHKHGRYLTHTHRSDDFINISPSAKKWPNPKPHSSLIDVLPIPAYVAGQLAMRIPSSQKAIQVAVVVKEESNGVTIIRNVKEIRDSGVDVPSDKLIGITDFPRPFYVLSEEELEHCKRPLRTVGESKDAAVKIDNLTYCQ